MTSNQVLSFLMIGIILLVSTNICQSHYASISEVSEHLKDAACKKINTIKVEDQDFEFTLDGCQFKGNISNSSLQGFSFCYIDSMKNSSSSIEADITFSKISWLGNATITLQNCQFAKNPTTINFWYNDLWSGTHVKLNVKIQKQGDEEYKISNVTADVTLDDGVTRLYSIKQDDPEDYAIVAQAASKINEGTNYIKEQFDPFKKNLGEIIAADIQKSLSEIGK